MWDSDSISAVFSRHLCIWGRWDPSDWSCIQSNCASILAHLCHVCSPATSALETRFWSPRWFYQLVQAQLDHLQCFMPIFSNTAFLKGTQTDSKRYIQAGMCIVHAFSTFVEGWLLRWPVFMDFELWTGEGSLFFPPEGPSRAAARK